VASDDDMRARIARHRATRPASWQTVEESLQLAQAVQHAASLADVVIVDCITTWLGNWLFAQQGDVDAAIADGYDYDMVLHEIEQLLGAIARLPANKAVLIVTNEVGLGIVPAYALGRVYRDMLGIVNQRLAREAGRVYLMVAGIAVEVKQWQKEVKLWQ
jgi:adenosylcobinamide kinase/adenosylcobinamide-phosphate guanylyltransferase